MRTTNTKTAFAVLLMSSAALVTSVAAQTTTPPDRMAPAVTTPAPTPDRGAATMRSDNTARSVEAPVPGANSFTEGQARSRIEGAGYSNLTGLKKDDQGIWRAQASRGGQTTGVSLDYQGNVTPAR